MIVTSGGYTTPCDYTVGNYEVYGTGSDGLYQHTGPGTSFAKVTNPNTLAEGTAVHIACQIITSSTVKAHLARALASLRDDLIPTRQQETRS